MSFFLFKRNNNNNNIDIYKRLNQEKK